MTGSNEEVTAPAFGRSNVLFWQTKRGLANGGDHVDADEVERGLMIDRDEDYEMVWPTVSKAPRGRGNLSKQKPHKYR